jgi:hypothetical protein
MKRLIICVAALASFAAFAHDDNQKAIDATEVGPRVEKKSTEAKKDATDVAGEMKGNAKEWGRQAGMATEEQGTFRRDAAFDLQGTAKKLTLGKFTIARQGLPAATLTVRDETVVMLDGKRVNAKEIPEGAPVRAKFQLEGNATVAVELDAQSPARK